MLTIYDFFNNLRNDQIIPITQCKNKDIFAFYDCFENFMRSISGVCKIGIPDNIDYNFLNNEMHNDVILDFLEYLADKVKQMEPHNKIYYLDCSDIHVKKDKFNNVLDWYFTFTGTGRELKDKLSSLCTIINLRDDLDSSYWYNQPPYVRYTDYTHPDYKAFNKIKELLTTIVIPIYNESESLELCNSLTKLKPELKVRVYYEGCGKRYPCIISNKLNSEQLTITKYDYHVSYILSESMRDVLQGYLEPNVSKYYIMVEIEYDSLINDSLKKLCNYLKMTSYWESTYLLMNDFHISTLISNKTLKDNVVNMHDVIAKL